jgi:prefoldin subunit 5
MEADSKSKGGHNTRGQYRGNGRGGNQERTKQPRRSNRGGHGAGGKPLEKDVEPKEFEHQHSKPGYEKQRQGYNKGGNYNRRNQRSQGGHGGRNPAINAAKDSFYYMYYYGPYPEIPKIEVALETEIPTIKEQDILKEPSKEDYAKKMKDCDDKIQELRTKITELNDKKREITSTKKEEGKTQQVEVKGKSFKQLLSEKNAVQNERKQLFDLSEKLNTKINKYKSEIDKLSKSIDVK